MAFIIGLIGSSMFCFDVFRVNIRVKFLVHVKGTEGYYFCICECVDR